MSGSRATAVFCKSVSESGLLLYCKMPQTNWMEWFWSVSEAMNCSFEYLICSLNGLNDCSLSPIAPDAAVPFREDWNGMRYSVRTCRPHIRARTFLQDSLKERKPHSFFIINVLHHNRTNVCYSALHNEAAAEVSPQQEVWRDLENENSTEHCVCFPPLEQLIRTFPNADNRWKWESTHM